ncbi:MAG: helix-turn-helix domain-containing protein [Xenococcaceae cyanobacterium MO_167.B27]|nr:helix-turn-helix domain-containing protein [Xenococcaceae cyanobacterium MO_167.B27]
MFNFDDKDFNFEEIIQQIQLNCGVSFEMAQKIFQKVLQLSAANGQLELAQSSVVVENLEKRVKELESIVHKQSQYLDKFIGYLNLEDRVEDKMRYMMEQFKNEIKHELAELRTVELTKGSLEVANDELEFYTVNATGESGMSQSALAKLAGVSQQALSKLEKALTTKSPSEYLKVHTGQDFYLTTTELNILTVDGKNPGKLTLYKAEYCGAVIAHYAMKGNQTAFQSMAKFCSMGITKWIQGITGWSK